MFMYFLLPLTPLGACCMAQPCADRLTHDFELRAAHNGKGIAVEMNLVALVGYMIRVDGCGI